MGELWTSAALDVELARQPRKRTYAPRKTRAGALARQPPNLASYPGLPAAAFAEAATATTHGIGPGRPHNHEIRMIEEQIASIRLSLSSALERWQRILQAALEEDNAHIAARAANEIEAIYTVLQRLEKL